MAEREIAELQQFSAEAVHEFKNCADQTVELKITRSDSTMFAPFPRQGLARDSPYYIPSVLSEEEALQKILHGPRYINLRGSRFI